MRSTDHSISANGLTHFVRDEGPVDAPAAVLVHGFPDSSDVWSPVVPALVAAGFRIIAPDMRGCGRTDMAKKTSDYDIHGGAVPDVIAVMDALGVAKAHLVGHDFGGVVAWALAARHKDRFLTLSALSVGHLRAFLAAGAEQKIRSWYILAHQLRGVAEAVYRFNDWAILRGQWSRTGDVEAMLALLKRPGRLTAALDWYRANLGVRRLLAPPAFGSRGDEIVRIPTLGVWSDGDRFLTEAQMTGSEKFVEAPWRYERINDASHWISYDAPERLCALLIGHWRAHSR